MTEISKSARVQLGITFSLNLICFILIEVKLFFELEKAAIDKNHVAYDLAIAFTVVGGILFIALSLATVRYVRFC